MYIKDIIKDIPHKVLSGSIEKDISNIFYDSREVIKDALFVCITGIKTDGHKYIDDVIKKGAQAIIVSKHININEAYRDITVIQVPDSRKALAIASRNFCHNPSKDFNLIGITGTNGKTTTTFLIDHILKQHHKKTGLIGTIENRINDKVIESSRTTPESYDLQKLLQNMKNEQVDNVIMEVSSHALSLDRVYGLSYKTAVFTNLSLDHLDYHKTMDNYLKAKAKLFKMSEYGVVNIDDKASNAILREAQCKKIYTYSTMNPKADFYANKIELNATGVVFNLIFDEKIYRVNYSTPGKFSVYNALAGIIATYIEGIPLSNIIEYINQFTGVSGRFETINSQSGYSVIVDYAHSPDGLLNVLKSIKEFAKGRVITVFGCGGDRDKSKRPIMGEIASEYSDFVIITSDNPRTENPETIIKEIEVGISKNKCAYSTILSRKEGIKFAITMAEEDDVILIAGKGHETYQEINDEIYDFNDVEIVKETIQEESNLV
ncbi:UDP-N-acetylmuramoylalanyl-D-glutamate--2,6-diaminopimelate ligase [Natranaerovirga hydrolytica]|uniref:UDP-N-acetylmuramoyl-L-alanyl-D-glutamate--2,6-diaminopimelate ligase n=1 Tax=Natranaerovirga hydrolytica TaxID=680378 RepID=A0A4R1N5H4_9FIRM|nr:UDP-N-acetylmuramoyl-L-alanyl-D-glutamate--2,6-diaminopimelate ligase [Natranaerovirga hydrolytica]TCK97863.1 UDP-N-acetylmuramoylalanyl-D-glutamate--2,6-diaminopimelate ligase [Natranaerovirga hydrolytica]